MPPRERRRKEGPNETRVLGSEPTQGYETERVTTRRAADEDLLH